MSFIYDIHHSTYVALRRCVHLIVMVSEKPLIVWTNYCLGKITFVSLHYIHHIYGIRSGNEEFKLHQYKTIITIKEFMHQKLVDWNWERLFECLQNGSAVEKPRNFLMESFSFNRCVKVISCMLGVMCSFTTVKP